MKIKAKSRNLHLVVTAKMQFGEEIDERALDAFSRIYLRGFLKPKLMSRRKLEYTGPIGISLVERFQKPVGQRDFLFILEQLVLAIQKIQMNNLKLDMAVFDLKYVYINEVTKELQLLYIPRSKGLAGGSLMQFVEDVIYSIVPQDEKAADSITRFTYFIKNQTDFDPELVEKYVMHEDRSVVNTIKRQNAGQSGFMTSKRQHYVEHYEEKNRDQEQENSKDEQQMTGRSELQKKAVPAIRCEVNPESKSSAIAKESVKEKSPALDKEEATTFLGEEEEEATTFLNEEEEEATTFLNEEEEEATTFLNEEEEEATTFLNEEEEEATTFLNEEEEATTFLNEEEDATTFLNEEEDATTFLNEEEDATALLVEENGTMLLAENRVRYPTLLRVLTNERISINKPVFRLGKEKSYVDYFVYNNNAVSRSHADIITRGTKFFVMDLNSKNHTYINDQMIPVQCETEIRDGDHLKLGNEEFLFNA